MKNSGDTVGRSQLLLLTAPQTVLTPEESTGRVENMNRGIEEESEEEKQKKNYVL